jgi:hypothetical protein
MIGKGIKASIPFLIHTVSHKDIFDSLWLEFVTHLFFKVNKNDTPKDSWRKRSRGWDGDMSAESIKLFLCCRLLVRRRFVR